MPKINARAKGANGEREFCKWLYENFNVPMPERNLNQVRNGGSDVIDIAPFFFEVKRCEILSLDAWWRQVNKAIENSGQKKIIPVVAFRQNRQPWRFLIPAKLIGVKKGYMQVTERVFIRWAGRRIVN